MITRSFSVAAVLAATALCTGSLALGVGCRRNYVEGGSNRLPVAVARAVDASGEPVDDSVNRGLGPIFPFAGEPVEITLDARDSFDVDGRIVAYRWLSGTLVDAGSARLRPEGAPDTWPDDRREPRVSLGLGMWTFSLWVTDDRGAISEPDTINVVVGEPPDAGASELMCMDMPCAPMVTLPTVPGPAEPCCDDDSGGGCGVVVSTMGECEALDQPGTDDASCPNEMSALGTPIAGCCKPDGKCGVRSGVLRGCIERSDYPPTFLMSMMQLTALDCGM
jgi:hypothetical protein